MLPEYRQLDLTWLADVPLLVKLAAWGSLVIEIGYPFFVWPPMTRKIGATKELLQRSCACNDLAECGRRILANTVKR